MDGLYSLYEPARVCEIPAMPYQHFIPFKKALKHQWCRSAPGLHVMLLSGHELRIHNYDEMCVQWFLDWMFWQFQIELCIFFNATHKLNADLLLNENWLSWLYFKRQYEFWHDLFLVYLVNIKEENDIRHLQHFTHFVSFFSVIGTLWSCICDLEERLET